ncbi:MarR family winged helix-turn-helix transcriptional regulator [Paraburkholderia dinghuensis]|uniref:MarR family transcriptional regulator n=1 Tax=Paraburkholderia dinghuensis TaxID=2305225 RepID=A0A3N6MMR4_9BURK|nr:MarR family winged helix-turn-helix transcriptional regulator [Paraburkholderia dinghuensis]RQH05019.1 MarR family transcriptional regulator [Paraburkholderia dinghuensis]
MTDPTPTTPLEVVECDFGESAGHLIARVKSSLSNLINQRTVNEFGVTSQQASVLLMVASGKCVLAAELAREYGIDASAVTRLVDRLEQRGLLERVRSSEDRRAVRLALTPEGQAIAACMPTIFTTVSDKLMNGLSSEETGFLKNMLRRVLANGCEASQNSPANS